VVGELHVLLLFIFAFLLNKLYIKRLQCRNPLIF
jgi:hypothetical protein